MVDETEEVSKGMVEGIIEALSDKHSQLNLRFQNLAVNLGGTRMGIQLTGGITMSVHLRDLTEAEKDAHAAANLAIIRA